MKFKLILALTLLALVAAAGSVCAVVPSTFSVTAQQGSEANTWIFTLANNDATGLVPVGLDLTWDDALDHPFTIVGTPVDWTVNEFWSFVNPAWDLDAMATPISNGQSTTGFKVTADVMPNIFTVYLVDALGSDAGQQSGLVTVPGTPVPEPGSTAAMLGGLAAIGGSFIRRRRA